MAIDLTDSRFGDLLQIKTAGERYVILERTHADTNVWRVVTLPPGRSSLPDSVVLYDNLTLPGQIYPDRMLPIWWAAQTLEVGPIGGAQLDRDNSVLDRF